MDIKIEVKEEVPFSEVISQTGRESFSQDVTMKLNRDTTVCNKVCEMETKTKIKKEPINSDICPQNDCGFFSKNLVMNANECNKDCEVDTKIEIKEELWWLERTFAEAPCVDDAAKDPMDESLPSPESMRLSVDATCTEAPGIEAIEPSQIGKDVYFHGCEKFEDCKTYISAVYSKEQLLIRDTGLQNELSGNIFPGRSTLKLPDLINEKEKVRNSEIYQKSFSQQPTVKKHKLTHERKSAHNCNNSFTVLPHFKKLSLIHEGRKPYKCNVCNKCFTQVGTLKRHSLIHEGKKAHQCNVCHKNFAQQSYLKIHILIHNGKRPHKCNVCNKSFTQISNLRTHSLIHTGKKPHRCYICDKRFTRLSHLKGHSLIHEDNKRHKCNICNKTFTRQSDLKRHSFIHEGYKPHKCNVCNKGFIQLSHLKRHSLSHEGKNHRNTM